MTVPGMSSAIHRVLPVLSVRQPSLIPLEPKEVEKILKTQGIESEPKTHISVEVGEEVRITEGPFENCIAVVTEVNEEKGTVKGLVNMFGRETPVEVDYSQIEKGLE